MCCMKCFVYHKASSHHFEAPSSLRESSRCGARPRWRELSIAPASAAPPPDVGTNGIFVTEIRIFSIDYSYKISLFRKILVLLINTIKKNKSHFIRNLFIRHTTQKLKFLNSLNQFLINNIKFTTRKMMTTINAIIRTSSSTKLNKRTLTTHRNNSSTTSRHCFCKTMNKKKKSMTFRTIFS